MQYNYILILHTTLLYFSPSDVNPKGHVLLGHFGLKRVLSHLLLTKIVVHMEKQLPQELVTDEHMQQERWCQ